MPPFKSSRPLALGCWNRWSPTQTPSIALILKYCGSSKHEPARAFMLSMELKEGSSVHEPF